MRKEPKPLADRFFEKQPTSSVDFEIAFAAFLATLVLTYPIPQYSIIGEFTAFVLLFITLVRRIALASPFAPTAQILNRTRPIVEISSTSAVICFIVYISWSARSFTNIAPRWIFSIITLFGLTILVLLQELVFRDYCAWWHAKFKQRFEDMETFRALWGIMSVLFLKLSIAEKKKSSREQWRERSSMPQEMPSANDLRSALRKDSAKLVIQIVVIALIFYALPMTVGYIGFGFSGLFLGISAVLIHDHSCFLYVAYGDPSYEEFRKSGWTIGLWMLIYVFELIILFPGAQLPFRYLVY
ncbi:hypothetical protein ACNO8S_13450 [Haloarcula sp. KBTZ06]|uniref:hypothetical protein n=1 Tax=Haloarcula sp. KBTZ06 TaxID=3402682 RepID=UPI003B42BDD0